jgi:hypothetical protein
VIVKLSDGTIYNIIIKPIFFKRKYIYWYDKFNTLF